MNGGDATAERSPQGRDPVPGTIPAPAREQVHAEPPAAALDAPADELAGPQAGSPPAREAAAQVSPAGAVPNGAAPAGAVPDGAAPLVGSAGEHPVLSVPPVAELDPAAEAALPRELGDAAAPLPLRGQPGRPRNERLSSRLSIFRRRDVGGATQTQAQTAGAPQIGAQGHDAAARGVFQRLSQRAQVNMRAWYNRGPKRKTEFEMLKDIQKSRLLYSEIAMGTPMVMAYASTMLQNEGAQRVPVLFEQIDIKVTRPNVAHLPGHTVKISIEYGSGPSMMKWSVLRGQRDLLLLHGHLVKTKVWHRGSHKPPHLPRFGQFKHARAPEDAREQPLTDVMDDHVPQALPDHERAAAAAPATGDPVPPAQGVDSGTPVPAPGRVPSGGAGPARAASPAPPGTEGFAGQSSAGPAVVPQTDSGNGEFDGRAQEAPVQLLPGNTSGVLSDGGATDGAFESDVYEDALTMSSASSVVSSESLRNYTTYEAAVQHYLMRLLHMYRFRADSNRLLTFLELSHLSIKLAPEYSFKGKEGHVIVRSRASQQGWRVRHWQPQDVGSMIQRHTNKWMLVRDSCIILTDTINSTRILDVFLVDSRFDIKHYTLDDHLSAIASGDARDQIHHDELKRIQDADDTHSLRHTKGFFLHVTNNSRSLKLATRGERDLARWQASISRMLERTPWSRKNRFDSYAPVRKNVFGQWFVDARDYMWVLSEALESARDTIFILDWWLSPELYLRRPAEGNQEWRLDRVLKRKAEQGVKIFVVVYRNVGATIPIDSQWTKHSLIDLHPNIHCLRSPNQFLQNSAVFWAHHEKVCVIDNTIGFNGGIDLCFGRWDTPQHIIVDDARHAFYKNNNDAMDQRHATQMWPGKDYSNPRVKDFFELDKPYDDMYDRQVVPRMPWHDIHQMVVGQPARDLARHFVQRWNYVIRQKLPSRETPLLLPPPDFTQEELDRLGLTGTCEYQVLRSSSNWSLGLKEHEQSIQNAYLKLIDASEHFVYIENQFFITSTVVDGIEIENKIGTALVQRIIRAHERNERWRAVIVIPLMPGFEADVDSAEASSVRVICQCQFNSISRGTNSIFYRLERAGIHPENYISFFSLRKWGKIGPERHITTSQLYIHAKCMVVDDRVAIIGSANLNERSMRGVRDSEVAVCVRDSHVIESRMGGKPWQASQFAFTLRQRLMREHLGVDVDKVDIIEKHAERLETAAAEAMMRQPAPQPSEVAGQNAQQEDSTPYWLYPELHSFNYDAGTHVNRGLRDHKKISTDRRVQNNSTHKADVDGDGTDQFTQRKQLPPKWATMRKAPPDPESEQEAEQIVQQIFEKFDPSDAVSFKRLFYRLWTKQTTNLNASLQTNYSVPVVDDEGNVSGNEAVLIDPWEFDDPVSDEFVVDKWINVAERNTNIYRQVFRCQPDNEVTTWKDYKKYSAHFEAFMRKQAEEGGTEVRRKAARPERVDKHVLTGTVKRTNPESMGYVNQDEAEGEDDDDSSSSSSDSEGGSYTGHPGYSTAAGLPGIPSIGAFLGLGEEPFDPKDSKYPEKEYPESVADKNDLRGNFERDSHKETQQKTTPPGTEGNGPPVQNGSAANGDASNASNGSRPHTSARPHKHRHRRHGYQRTEGASRLGPSLDQTPEQANGKPDPELQNKHHHDNIFTRHRKKEKEKEREAKDPLEQKHGTSDGLVVGSISPLKNKNSVNFDENVPPHGLESSEASSTVGTERTKRFVSIRRWKHFDQVFSAQTAEQMLAGVTGHLVLFPTEWLSRELDSGNWNFQMDRMTPLEIYD